jgi:hypothetical protein
MVLGLVVVYVFVLRLLVTEPSLDTTKETGTLTSLILGYTL